MPYGEANVWWPVADALRHGCGHPLERPRRARPSSWPGPPCAIALGEGATAAEVERVHQGLLYLMGYDSELRDIEPARAREEATAAVVTYAERYSLHRPVVVVLSDLHWADDLVLELVDTLLDRLASRRFVVLATARQVVEERWHPPHGRHNLVVVTLDPLTTRQRRELLLEELAGPDLGPELAQGAARPQRWQPLLPRGARHACWPTRAWSAASAARAASPASVWWSSPTRCAASWPLASTVSRLDERRVLDDCAVLGRRGPMKRHRGDGRQAPRDRRRGPGARRARGQGPPRPERARRRARKWTFRSDLVREVAYSTLTKADRARSHAGHRHVDGGPRGRRARRRRRPHHLPLRAGGRAGRTSSVPSTGSAPTSTSERCLARGAAARASHAEIPVVAERLYE